ncbi:hypothetical protein F5884DRAFT_229710 [Xylogone sp. PMI_703]|nr:hypothetical protein F5884DRAFT_229710 [Xylogone sp. PMI_703]
MQKSVLVSQYLLPVSSVSLGRFITNIDEPHQDYHDPVYTSDLETAEKIQIQYDGIHQSGTDRKAKLQLTAFLSSAFSKRLKASIRVSCEQAKTYFLQNCAQSFRKALEDEETRRWIERTIDEGEDVYLVTGYHTLLDARIYEYSGDQQYRGTEITVPLSTALAASGVIVPFGEIMNPGLGVSHGRIEDIQKQFTAPGEQVFAVQYRRVRHKWFRKADVEKFVLDKKIYWERYDRPRYLQGEPEDSIEVELQDEIALDAQHEEFVADLGETYISVLDAN